MNEGRQMREKRDLQRAMVAYANNPEDMAARRTIYMLNPSAGIALEDQAHERSERQRAGRTRSALSDILLARMRPQRSALAGNASPRPSAFGSPGNIDLNSRPVVNNPDGSFSTVSSKSFNFDGKEVLLPTISDDGRRLSDAEAIAQYRGTGRHLGAYRTAQEATEAAQGISAGQAARYAPAGSAMPARSVFASAPPSSVVAAPDDIVVRGRQPPAEGNAWERLIRDDPETAITVRSNLAKLSKSEIEALDELNDVSLELISTVTDQESYGQAKARAHQLYVEHGHDPSAIDALPDEYQPELLMRLREQAMSTKDLLAAHRAERKLEWDLEDDSIDNQRADREAGARDRYRRDSLRVRQSESAANRAARAREARLNRGARAAQGEASREARAGERFPDETVIEMPDGSQRIRKNGRWVPYDGG